MIEVRFSAQAEDDVEDIYLYTARQFGIAQAMQYRAPDRARHLA